MASKQTNIHTVIAQAVAEAPRAAIQAMAAAGNEKSTIYRTQTRQTSNEATQFQLGSRR